MSAPTPTGPTDPNEGVTGSPAPEWRIPDGSMQDKGGSSFVSSVSVMAVATFLSRIMGLIREQSFAYFFGAGIWTDAFNVAFRIPNLLRDLFAEGAMSAAFVPTFNFALKQEGKERAFRLTNLTLNALLVVISAFVTAGIIFSPELIRLLAPEFSSNPEKFDATVLMTRIMFPFLLAISWAAIVMGILNSLGEFFIPAIAPVFMNFSLILAGFTLCPMATWLGYPSIVGMAVGALLGGYLQLGVQFPALFRSGFRLKWVWNLKDKGLKKIGSLIIPGTIGSAATQMNVAISTILATSQGPGAVSWLMYAFRLMQLPLGIFGVAIAQATLPLISRQAADNDRESMARTIASSIKLTAFINISATLALAALSEPIIRILFEHGRFSAADTIATASALRAYAAGLFFFSLVKVLAPAFYTINDTKTPVTASILSVVLNIALNLALISPCGYWGLPLGTSLAAAANSAILYVKLVKKLPLLATLRIWSNILAILTASTAAGCFMRLVFSQTTQTIANSELFRQGSFCSDVLGLSVAGLAGFALLMFISKALGLAEADQAWAMIKRRLFRRGASSAK